MNFTCNICQNEISICGRDRFFYEAHRWECNHCYSVLFKKRYPVNLPGRTTVFTPMGGGLGDRVLAQIIRDEYLKANPDENVVFLEGELKGYRQILDLKPAKIFWANLWECEDPEILKRAYWFSLCTETEYYARDGQYARLWFEPEPILETDLAGRYVVCHFRNMATSVHKNVDSVFSFGILAALRDWSRYFDRLVLIGNEPVEYINSAEGMNFLLNADIKFLDLRNRLSLPQLAFVLGNAFLYIGADSGPVHLAAAAGCRKIIAWNFGNDHWYPRAPAERLVLWHKRNSSVENVATAIGRELVR